MSSNLILHAGANEATEADVLAVPTPEPSGDWYPIPHADMVHAVERAAEASGWVIDRREYGLFRDGLRMFGLMLLHPTQVEIAEQQKDYRLALGVRNSHDKTMSAGLVVGSHVFVCDNLAFSGEVKLLRKHTRFIARDLDRLVMQAMGRVGDSEKKQQRRIEAYKGTDLSDMQVHDLLVRSVDAKIIPNADLPKVLGEYRKPQHEEFEARTAWSLFNAYTEVMKGVNPLALPNRTQRLHGMLDLTAKVIEGVPLDQAVADATPDFEFVE